MFTANSVIKTTERLNVAIQNCLLGGFISRYISIIVGSARKMFIRPSNTGWLHHAKSHKFIDIKTVQLLGYKWKAVVNH